MRKMKNRGSGGVYPLQKTKNGKICSGGVHPHQRKPLKKRRCKNDGRKGKRPGKIRRVNLGGFGEFSGGFVGWFVGAGGGRNEARDGDKEWES
jgi:hypothetical protein